MYPHGKNGVGSLPQTMLKELISVIKRLEMEGKINKERYCHGLWGFPK